MSVFNRKTILQFIEKQLNVPEQIFVLSTLTKDGFPDARIMGNICEKSVKEIFFTCPAGTRKIEEINNNPKSCVYFTFDKKTVWLYGNAAVTRDEDVRRKIWNKRMLPIYHEGVHSPRLNVICFIPKKVRFRGDAEGYIEFEL